MIVMGKDISLKLLSENDANSDYVNWMNDKEIVSYLESRWQVFTVDKLQEYIKKTNDGSNNFLFGIYANDSGTYIGNIKIGSIEHMHRRADIGIIIGNKEYWGKGFATEAIKLATEYSFNELNLNKLIAGMYSPNIGSYKAFIQAGFEEVGIFKKHCFFNGKYVDSYILEIINSKGNKQ